jgi:hypothetical protein
MHAMLKRLKRLRQIVQTAVIGGVGGAYALTGIVLRLQDNEAEIEYTLRFMARLHGTLQMLDRLVVDMYEESIRESEIELPSEIMMKRFQKSMRKLWFNDEIADSVGQVLLRRQGNEIH